MNDSLEFIKSEIAITKNKYKTHLKFNQTAFAIRDEKQLKQLQQIKTELEAWEAIKELLIKSGEPISLSVLFRYHREVYNKINKTYEVQK